jgi:AmmeMemoRadiSam system protein B
MTESLPKLRPLNVQWVDWEGRPMVSLQDPLRLGGAGIMVPEIMAQLLGLSDGTRDLEELRRQFVLRTGMSILPSQLESLVQALDDALLLDNSRFRRALAQAMDAYRDGPFRSPALAGGSYPADPRELLKVMDQYTRQAQPQDGSGNERLAGVISPHIDYPRGWRTYAETWNQTKAAVGAADRVIILGTDHAGSPGSLTLTHQSYATPWGALPTDTAVVTELASILGEDRGFAEEAHHIGEHSIELAAVWLHYIAGGTPKNLVPILCGGPEPFLEQEDSVAKSAWQAIDLLAGVTAEDNTLVIAAADISHVGPAFSDKDPLDDAAKLNIKTSDELWLEAACAGDSGRLRGHMVRHGDPTRICGASPIFLMASMLGEARGRVVHYDQCPADEGFGSLVSIAGVVYNR